MCPIYSSGNLGPVRLMQGVLELLAEGSILPVTLSFPPLTMKPWLIEKAHVLVGLHMLVDSSFLARHISINESS